LKEAITPELNIHDTLEEKFRKVYFDYNKNDNSKYKSVAAIFYLVENKYLEFLNENFDMRITYKGILKYSKGFVDTYNEESLDKKRLKNVENIMLFVNS